MIRFAAIYPALFATLLIMAASCGHAQPVPPAQEWSIQSALAWQVPQSTPPVTNVTLTLAAPLTVQASDDLGTWVNTSIPANVTFTVPNDRPARFFRLARRVQNNVSWQAVAGAAGYRIYVGPESGFYLQTVDLGNVTSAQIVWPYVVNFYVLTAYDAVGNESDFGSEQNI